MPDVAPAPVVMREGKFFSDHWHEWWVVRVNGSLVVEVRPLVARC